MSLALDFLKGSLKKRMLWSIIGSVSIVFLLTAFVTILRVKATLIEEKHHEIEAYSEQFADRLSLSLEQVSEQVKVLDVSLGQTFNHQRGERRRLVEQKLKESLEGTNDLLKAIWTEWEPQAIDSLDAQMVGSKSASSTGRFSCAMFRDAGSVLLKDVSADDDASVFSNDYYQGPKMADGIYVTKPYFDDYAGVNILMISVSAPIKIDGVFKGVVGADVNISSINNTIKSSLGSRDGRFFVIDSNQMLLLYDDESKVGKSTAEVLSNGTGKNDEILSAIKEKKTGLYDYYDENGDRCIAHVSEAKIFNEGEVSVLVIPYSFISKTIGEIIGIGLILIVLALSIVYFVTVYIVRRIVLPVEKVTNVLKALGDGEFDKASHVDVKTHDEIETMATSLNSLYDSIEEVAVFAENIGSGKLSVEFKSKGSGDILGNSLIKMREGLVKADEEAKLRKMEDEKQSWIERSVANFGKELRNEHGDTKSFYNNIIRIIVRDLEVNQAALYLINDNDESNKFFEVVACMAWGREKMQKKTFMLEEGLLGACYFEREPIVLTEIPEDYVSITSGLGGANPKVLMLVPLIYNENVIGVVEVASFKVLEDHKKTYLLHVSEIFASTLVSIRVNARTNELLSISQMQAEEMAAQEEEMRQNLEELHATQEEMKRKTQKAELMQQAVEESFISITIDRQLSVVHSNAIGASIIGENALSVASINLESLVVESDREALRAAVGAALAGKIETVGLTFKGRQGSRHIQATLVAEQEMNSHITIIGYEVR